MAQLLNTAIQQESITGFMNRAGNVHTGALVYAAGKKPGKKEPPVTEEPMAEKDEVKKAEERTQKLQGGTKKGTSGTTGKK